MRREEEEGEKKRRKRRQKLQRRCHVARRSMQRFSSARLVEEEGKYDDTYDVTELREYFRGVSVSYGSVKEETITFGGNTRQTHCDATIMMITLIPPFSIGT